MTSVLTLPVHLYKQEYAVLAFLAMHQGEVFPGRDLLRHVWGKPRGSEGKQGTVSVHMKRLRDKLETDPAGQCFIESVFGYRFKPPVTVHSRSEV